ncbi:MAG TPA: YhbY family RNA-binding protein [Burkholderiales bacterium]|nr:YhbY family RNA-binding protein [Burkholderiales bacterium]
MNELTAARRRALKALAHKLTPVVLIGDKGLTPQVLEEIDRALAVRELIKVRAGTLDRDARASALTEICAHAGAQAVQHIGKILVVYREKPRVEAPTPPAPRPHGATRSERRESRSASSRPGSARPPRPRRTSRSGRARSGS